MRVLELKKDGNPALKPTVFIASQSAAINLSAVERLNSLQAREVAQKGCEENIRKSA